MNKIEQEADNLVNEAIVGGLHPQSSKLYRTELLEFARSIHNAALSEAIERLKDLCLKNYATECDTEFSVGLTQANNEAIEILEGLKIKP